ncbi:MAG: hypothetical protein OHK0052_07610 [Anaerolineales bacterium]
MPQYDTAYFDPPAPLAEVALVNPLTGSTLTKVMMLIDTGADVTLLPKQAVSSLEIGSMSNVVYQIQGFGGSVQFAESIECQMLFLGKRFKGKFLLIDEPIGILGRNILNALPLIFDGPKQQWDELKR